MRRNNFHLAFALAGAIQFAGVASNAAAKGSAVSACPQTITTCGCTITKPGNYTITTNLTGTASQDCIDISAAKVNLRSDAFALTGAGGNSVGINVLKSAANVNLQLADPTNPDNISVITGFDVGIEIQASGAIVTGFDVSENQSNGLLIKGSSCSVTDFVSDLNQPGNGVTISGASGCQLSDFTASGNGGVGLALVSAKSNTVTTFDADDVDVQGGNIGGGVTLTASSSNILSGFSVDNNQVTGVTLTNSSKNQLFNFDASGSVAGSGVALSGSSSNAIFDFSAFDNSIYGVWLNGSSSNSVRFAITQGNMQAGVYLGCGTNGVGGSCGSGAKTSTKNIVTGIIAGNDTTPTIPLPEAHGIAADRGDLLNSLSGLTASGDSNADLDDENANCGTNAWFANSGAIVNPAGSPSCTEL
ncbi:MAG TPA: right-handed parallel beta-helix repeat-containing protein [Candidatus Binataceae bacterium]|nr:right-handed parallel beta-helix repeat-containing protein [Candidatus Binataceae bacterium]